VCCTGRSAPSQCGVGATPGFSSPIQPVQERTTAYRDSSGPKSCSDAHRATIVGNWEEPSGESRFKQSLRDYWADAALLIVATAFPVVAALLDFSSGSAEFFQRSGSIVVAIAAFIEYRQAVSERNAKDGAHAANKRRSWAGVPVVGNLPAPRKWMAVIALFYIAVGTIIWGFGNLFLPEFNFHHAITKSFG